MARARVQIQPKSAGISERARRLLREAAALLLFPLAVYLFACLIGYSMSDPGWWHAGVPGQHVHNFGGAVGAYIADLLFHLFGVIAYAFPLLLIVLAVGVLRGWYRRDEGESKWEPSLRLIGFVAFFVGGCGLAWLHESDTACSNVIAAGGLLGCGTGDVLHRGIGELGTLLLLFALALIAVTWITGLSWFRVMDWTGQQVLVGAGWARGKLRRAPETLAARAARVERETARKEDTERRARREPMRIEPAAAPILKSERAKRETQIPLFTGAASEGELPPLSLLEEPQLQSGKGYSEETLEVLSRQVEMKLKDFRIDAHVVSAHPGPVITRFELEPAPGIRGSQISSLDKDIARGLSLVSVRVVDVIPGKNVIGLEIPNAHREIVYLKEIFSSREYGDTRSPLSLALGKDIGGRPVVVDLQKMPHLLVAGTTGSGKSVALNAMVLSLLFKANPKEVNMVMIDPKMLELSIYEGIPHLWEKVITDMKEASTALRKCVVEMEKRYKLMAAVGVRNLAGFNKKVRDEEAKGQPLLDPLFVANPDIPNDKAQPLQPLPFVVVIVDEFADMMMIVGKKVEELIARLAQKSRAAGIHLILATQRPSVDVITGLIKANIPTRIAFQVSSKIDSRTILDQSGAETLLGNGDMLYLPPGTATPERVHGAFVSDDEVHRVVAHWRTQGNPIRIDGMFDDVQTMGDGKVINESGLPEDAGEGEGGMDELYDRAVYIVTSSRRASISGVQRHLRIGYNRAARLIEMMEQQGVVTPPQHNGNREVIAPPPPQ
ncbi:MAG TPA: DNA translocase FtsK 4TM domain-containing protein [Rhodanobacteraceae bacterium]|nr:DNA translocase FtsK 4TM domain-containing protein [Rhodanobacteraceae bacterium]